MPGFDKAAMTLLIASLPYYHWSRVSDNLVTSPWHSIRISYAAGHYHLTRRGDLTSYRYKFLGEVVNELMRMSDSEQLRLEITCEK
jgi:hypothetical protein